MTELDFSVEIPFVENSGRRCVPACTAMILKTLIPERNYSKRHVEELSGFREGKATWAAQHLLSLADMGVDVGWIQDEDLPSFAENPIQYMRQQITSEESFSAFQNSNDLPLEAARVRGYLTRGLPFEQRPATKDDITARLTDGWLVRLELNGKVLANQPGNVAHTVLVSGFSDSSIRLENPDGLHGSKPKQIVSWDILHQAWEDPIMQFYKKAA